MIRRSIKSCGSIWIVVFLIAFVFQVTTLFAANEGDLKKRVTRTSPLKKKLPGKRVEKPLGSQFPVILTVSPGSVFQGQTATVMISGQHLNPNMVLKLGSGITTSNLTLLTDTGTMATAQISVSSSASPGTRVISVQFRDQIRQTSATLTVNSLYQPTVIHTVAPNSLFQGRRYTVMVTGVNLSAVSKIEFGPGITAKKISRDVDTASSIMMELVVAATAQPGQRKVSFADQNGQHETNAVVIVMKNTAISTGGGEQVRMPTSPPPASDVSRTAVNPMGLVPNRWRPGKSYSVAVFGSDLEEKMEFSLGEGVRIDDIDLKNQGMARLDITIDKQANPGPRHLKYRTHSKSGWLDTHLQGLIISSMKVSRNLPKAISHIPVTDLEFKKSVIELKTPEFGKFLLMENWVSDHGIPTSNDAVVFTWKEKQQGTSQWFELRILDKHGNVLLSRKIEGQPNPDAYYEPDVEFLSEMFKLFRPGATESGSGQIQKISPKPSTTIQSAGSGLQNPSGEQAIVSDEQYIQEHLQEIDCFWQVAGFKRFVSSVYQLQTGTVKTTSNDVEVAISDRWPLKLPEYSPTGLICSAANTELTAAKYSEQLGKAVEDHNFFVGDTIEISGKFSLDGCPWAIGYDTHWDKVGIGPAAGLYQVRGWSFYNVVMDWGDGSWDYIQAWPTEKMNAYGSKKAGLDPDDASGQPVGTIEVVMKHVYRYPQKFPIRMFVLPEDDMGSIESIVSANKSQPGQQVLQVGDSPAVPETENTNSAAAMHLTASKAGKPEISQQAQTGPALISGFDFPGSRAFLVYCQPKVVDIKADPAATGDLHLIRLNIEKFSGQGVDPDAPKDISGLLDGQGRMTIPPNDQKITLPGRGGGTSASQKSHLQQMTAAPQNKPALKMNQNSGIGAILPATDAVASACDEGFFATAKLEYFGLGRITLIWKVDGIEIARTQEAVGPSPIRQELNEDNEYIEPERHGFITFTSPRLPLDAGGSFKKYELTVEAGVVGYETAEYMEPVDQWVGGVHLHTPGSPEYIKYVRRSAEPKTYLVKAPRPGFPCAFFFPVADGKFFTISNIQNRVTKKNGKYSGQGTLYFMLPDGPTGMTPYSVEININNWIVSDDQTVIQGAINQLGIGLSLDTLQGVKGTLKSLKGKSGEPLSAVMDIFIKDSGLHRVGAVTPPQWLNISADLIPEDGWYAEGKAMPETEIYWSDFRISSNDIKLDLSMLRGDKPKAPARITASSPHFTTSSADPPPKQATRPGRKKQPSVSPKLSLSSNKPQFSQTANRPQFRKPGWTGVDLGKTALVYPFLFDLADMTVPAKGWNITDSGIEGTAQFKNFSYVLGDGSISFDSIDITAGDQKLDAVYNNVNVNIPWPKISLSGGNAAVNYIRGQDASQLAFQFDVQNLSVTESYQNIDMTSQIKGFQRMGSGWGILTDTTFEFSDGKHKFVTARLDDLFFNVFGEAHFPGAGDQVHNRTVPINKTTVWGDAEYAISNLSVSAPADMLKPGRLFFTFNGEIKFDEAFNACDVDVMYRIEKPLGKAFGSAGPSHSQIEITSTYPNDVDPLVKIEVKPEIALPGSTGFAQRYEPVEDSFFSRLFVSTAYASQGVQDSFRGTVDSTMFGDVPLGVQASFRYGAYNNKTYWLTYVTASNIDVPIFTGVNLKTVNGGMGHGFSADVFETDPMNAIPDSPDSTIYSAGIRVGFPGAQFPNIYEMAGRLTVNPGDGIYRMKFDEVRIFGVSLAGGYFEYDDSVFEGNLWGGFSLYQGAISCEIPENSEKVGLHFGDDKWEIWAGKKSNPIELKLFKMLNTKGYYQLGSDCGYKVGGGMSFSSGKLCFALFGAKAWADAQMGVGITPGQLDGEFWISAGLHGYVPCSGDAWDDSFSQSVKVEVQAPPLEMRGEVVIDVPDWLPGVPDDVTFGFDI